MTEREDRRLRKLLAGEREPWPFLLGVLAMPGSNAGATYMLSDGYGVLTLCFSEWVVSIPVSRIGMNSGNIFDGVRFDNYFGSDQGPAPGEWAHFAVGWDGQNIITYYNGVPVGKTPFAGPRRTPGPGGAAAMYSSAAQTTPTSLDASRKFEGMKTRILAKASLAVLSRRSLRKRSSASKEICLATISDRGASASQIFHKDIRVNHRGWARGTTQGVLFDCGACPPPQYVIDLPPRTLLPTRRLRLALRLRLPQCQRARVFDSFSRVNSTYLFVATVVWAQPRVRRRHARLKSNQPTDSPQPFGILNSIAVLLAHDVAIAWVETGSSTGSLDVRVDRRKGRWGRGTETGLSFRVIDASNYFFAYTSGGSSPNSQLLKVDTT